MGEEEEDGWARILFEKASTRLCEHPTHYFTLERVVLQFLQQPSQVKTLLEKKLVLKQELELIFTVLPYSNDLLKIVDIGLHLGQQDSASSTSEKPSLLTCEKPARAYRKPPHKDQGDSTIITLQTLTEQAKIGLNLKRLDVIKSNRLKVKKQHRHHQGGEDKVFTISKYSQSHPSLYGWIVPEEGSRTRNTNRTDDNCRHQQQRGKINYVNRIPCYTTSISIQNNTKAREDDLHFRFPIRSLKTGEIVSRSGHKQEEDDDEEDDYMGEDEIDYINNDDEEALEEVIYEVVTKCKPHDWTISELSTFLKIPSVRLIRTICAELSLNQAPEHSNRHLPFKLRETFDPNLIIDKYRELFCPRCCLFDCKLHEIRNPPKRSRLVSAIHNNVKIPNGLTHNASKAIYFHCLRLFPNDPKSASTLMAAFEDKKISFPSTSSVVVTEQQQKGRVTSSSSSSSAQQSSLGNNSNVGGISRVLPSRRRQTVAWHEPCNHEGPCQKDGNCTCMNAGLFCQRHCICDEDKCANIFQGCRSTCGGGATNSFRCCQDAKICKCRAIGFECTKEHCGCQHTKRCCNQNLQRGKTPELAIGFSAIHRGGWGTFTKQVIEEGEFIGEYCGEIIEDSEAERRGSIYDKMNMSFLFDLCKGQYVVDSFRMGSKMKWINHLPDPPDSSDSEREDEEERFFREEEEEEEKVQSTKSRKKAATTTTTSSGTAKAAAAEAEKKKKKQIKKAKFELFNNKKEFSNCKATVFFVRGEPHITLFAKRRIEEGEELSFDYHHSSRRGTTVPVFYKKSPF